LLHNELLNDYNKRLRINNYVGMTDISGCFNRILPSIVSLLNRKNGCPKEAVKMHASTLKKAQYHLKTQHRISDEYYSNATTPVYGNGQGAGDSPSQWSQESAMLFQLYEEMTTNAKMCDRFGETMTTLPIAAFADDTNLLGNKNKNNSKINSVITTATKALTSPGLTWDGTMSPVRLKIRNSYTLTIYPPFCNHLAIINLSA
jgi:hypothetical protein